ncbi:trypco2 family protein [Streptomyces sioyaensis]|uniref:trypco2 family protein n=1 Tax=Streptomyces sioyaensis TaxID=67364 RepID=UPI00379936E5
MRTDSANLRDSTVSQLCACYWYQVEIHDTGKVQGVQDPLGKIELAEAVQGIRDQLLNSANSANGQQIKFEVGEIDLDFTVELRRDASTKAGFKAWVVTGEAQGSSTRTATHRVSIKLHPKYSNNGQPVEIGNPNEVNLSNFHRSPSGATE